MASNRMSQGQENEKNLEFLLMGFEGEQVMMKDLDMLSMKSVEDGSLMWQPATHDYDLNAFGKLIKRPARTHSSGKIIDHKMHYHGFFANLRCNFVFYNRYKKHLDVYITHDKNIKREFQPMWYK